MPGAFEGYKVVDFSEGLAGPFTSMRLADAGAEVLKVETKAGDVTRRLGPKINGESAIYLALNRNKKSIALDQTVICSRDVIRRLVLGADVVVADRLSAWGDEIDYARLSEINPKLVYCSISAFGDEGPMKDAPGSELTAQAMSDYVNSLGVHGEAPVRVGADIANMNTGIFASQAIAAGLFHRARKGEGQRVSVSLLGSLVHMRGLLWTCLSNPDDWYGLFNDHYTKAPDHGYRTARGRVFWGLRRGDSEDWDRLLIELDLFQYSSDPRFANYGRMATSIGRYAPEAKPIWEEAFIAKGMKREDVISLIHSVKGDAVPFSDYETLVTHPQVAAVSALGLVDQGAAGRVTTIGSGWKYSDIPASPPAPAPAFAADSQEILLKAGFGEKEILNYRELGAIV
jgi:crotonobetainyl-CoA:carnitine CoA-transferase CaiB-like acyl-CoA transferase